MPYARATSVLAALAVATLGAWPVVAEVEEACEPMWYKEQVDNGIDPENVTCPFGVKLPFDVTWSNHLREDHIGWLVLNVFYGYVPLLLIGVAVVEFLCVRGTRELSFVLFIVFTVVFNEGILKLLVKQRRPPESCCTSCGMPSSHSTFAAGFFTLMFLDAAHRVNPMDISQKASFRSLLYRHTICTGGPLSHPTTLSNRAFVYVCLQWGLLLLPVPVSRIFLQDHTAQQVMIGSAAGIVYAMVYFNFVLQPFARRMKYAESWRWPRDTKYGYLLRNNLKLPWWRQRPIKAPEHSHEDQDLCYGRHLTHCEVPITSVIERDGRKFGVLKGQQLEVWGGKWSGVAWPMHLDTGRRREHGDGELECMASASEMQSSDLWETSEDNSEEVGLSGRAPAGAASVR